MSLLVALAAGAVLGIALGALGAGGSLLAVPILAYVLGQSPAQATTGSLVVVGVTALLGAVTARRAGAVLLGRGVAFGVIAVGGAAVGAKASAHVPEDVLWAAFSALMVLVGLLMLSRRLRARRPGGDPSAAEPADRWSLDDPPMLTLRPRLTCQCPRVLKVAVTATVVGLLTGFLGVGGGFLVVPALMLALAVPAEYAAGTSLVVIAITSAAALAVRSGAGVSPDWGPVLALTAAAAAGGVAGSRISRHADRDRLADAFTALILTVATGSAIVAVTGYL